jgi:hypothetical protein
LVSCLFLEDFPEVLSIADVWHGGEKYRAAACGGRSVLRFAPLREVISQPDAPQAEFC